jgi:sec-independent protein translocase protein TatA
MFGTLGGPEFVLILILALLLFGPRRLPEIGRTLGKAMAELRNATREFRVGLERDVELERGQKAEPGPRPPIGALAGSAPAEPEALPARTCDGDGQGV